MGALTMKKLLIFILFLTSPLVLADSTLPYSIVKHSTAYEASHVFKATKATLISLVGYNSKASAQFIQVHDAATLPADTAVPVYSFKVEATQNFSLDVPLTGIQMAHGIVVCNSSTGPTKTIGSADVFFTVVYR